MLLDSDLRREAHRRLITNQEVPDRRAITTTVSELSPLLERQHLEALVDQLVADISGLGVLEPLLHDPSISDVMVVGNRGVWIERSGVVEETGLVLGVDEVTHLIERVVAPLGLRVDRSSPIVDARLADGSRVNAVVPPLAVDGPCLTIRRFAARTVSIDEFASPDVADLLTQAVKAKMNILISGGTGAGKTTLLNALASHISDAERLVTVEDAAELRLPLRHVVRLESRPANSEGVGQVSLRELVRNALRMRPDRIIVGEVRGGEALDMLQAMNTGHEGSMSTCHANSPVDALSRIETMVLMSNVALPLEAVRQQIASSIDLVVQVSRTGSAKRQITSVAEVFTDRDRLALHDLTDGPHLVSVPQRPSRARRAA